MPVRSANTRQARCSCTSGPAPWNPCHHLGDIDAVVPGPDHGLEPTRRDDAGVQIDPGVRVDKGLITFHRERLEERNARRSSRPDRGHPADLTTDTLLPGASPQSDPGVSPKHTQRQRATSHASSMSSSSTYTDRSTSRIPSATVVIPSAPLPRCRLRLLSVRSQTTRRSKRYLCGMVRSLDYLVVSDSRMLDVPPAPDPPARASAIRSSSSRFTCRIRCSTPLRPPGPQPIR